MMSGKDCWFCHARPFFLIRGISKQLEITEHFNGTCCNVTLKWYHESGHCRTGPLLSEWKSLFITKSLSISQLSSTNSLHHQMFLWFSDWLTNNKQASHWWTRCLNQTSSQLHVECCIIKKQLEVEKKTVKIFKKTEESKFYGRFYALTVATLAVSVNTIYRKIIEEGNGRTCMLVLTHSRAIHIIKLTL